MPYPCSRNKGIEAEKIEKETRRKNNVTSLSHMEGPSSDYIVELVSSSGSFFIPPWVMEKDEDGRENGGQVKKKKIR